MTTTQMRGLTQRRFLIEKLRRWMPPTRFFKSRARMYRWAGLDVHRSARIVSSASLLGSGPMEIGADSFVGHQCLLIATEAGIRIGSNVDIAPRVFIGTGSHDVDMSGLRSAGAGRSAEVIVEDGVWIGAGSIVLPGVSIGRKAVIAAGSVVTTDIPAFVMAAGVPCRPVKAWNALSCTWERL